MDNLLRQDLDNLSEYVDGLQNRVELLRKVHDNGHRHRLLNEALYYASEARMRLQRIVARVEATPDASPP